MACPRLSIALHLGPEEIARRYRVRRSGRGKTHWLLTRTEIPPTPAQGGVAVAWVRIVLTRS